MLRTLFSRINEDERGIIGLGAGQRLYYVLGTADPFFADTDDTNNTLIDLYHDFTLELKPATGATLRLEQETPGQMDTLTNLL
jgi:hypothetical protein